MTEDSLRTLFESCSLPESQFDHETHVRMAWTYLRDEGLENGSEAFTRDLRTYVASLGATDKYHETITRFFLIVLHRRMRRGPVHDWPSFRAAHPDLVGSASSLLNRHYSRELLQSNEARESFLPPDLEALSESEL